MELVSKYDESDTVGEVYFRFQSIVFPFLAFRWSVFSVKREVMHCTFHFTSIRFDTVVALSSFTSHRTFKANGGPLGYPVPGTG